MTALYRMKYKYIVDSRNGVKQMEIKIGKYLNIRISSDKTGPQHLSTSSIIITTGLSLFAFSLYHDAKTAISAACPKSQIRKQVRT